MQILAAITRDARPKNMMMAAFDHINGVDLQISQMLYGRESGFWAVAKRRRLIEALSAQPDQTGGAFR